MYIINVIDFSILKLVWFKLRTHGNAGVKDRKPRILTFYCPWKSIYFFLFELQGDTTIQQNISPFHNGNLVTDPKTNDLFTCQIDENDMNLTMRPDSCLLPLVKLTETPCLKSPPPLLINPLLPLILYNWQHEVLAIGFYSG